MHRAVTALQYVTEASTFFGFCLQFPQCSRPHFRAEAGLLHVPEASMFSGLCLQFPQCPRVCVQPWGTLCARGLLSRYLWFAAPTAPRRARPAPYTAEPSFRGLCAPPSPPPALAAGFLHVRSPNYFLLNLHASIPRLHAGQLALRGLPASCRAHAHPLPRALKRPLKTLWWDQPLSSPLCRGQGCWSSHAPAPPQAGLLLQASRNLRLEAKRSLKYASFKKNFK